MCIVCTNDCPLTSLKQFFNFTQQKSVKHINISCKVTFGFKYIYDLSLSLSLSERIVMQYNSILTFSQRFILHRDV